MKKLIFAILLSLSLSGALGYEINISDPIKELKFDVKSAVLEDYDNKGMLEFIFKDLFHDRSYPIMERIKFMYVFLYLKKL